MDASDFHNGSLSALLPMLTVNNRDLCSIVDETVKSLCEVLSTKYCLVLQHNKGKQTLEVLGGTDCGIPESIKLDSSHQWGASYALKSEQSFVVNDYREETRLTKMPQLDANILSGAYIIIKDAKQVFGILAVYSEEPGYFSDHILNLLQAIAILVGVAIERDQENTRAEQLNKQLKEEISHTKKLQRKILKKNMYEQWEIGNYLNEELAQDILATDLMIRSIAENINQSEVPVDLDDLQEIMQRTVKGASETFQKMMPIDIKDDGAFYAFQQLARNIENLYRVQCEMESNQDALSQIDDVEQATQLYHITKAIIKNAILYRDTQHIRLHSYLDNGRLHMVIDDDGSLYSSAILKGEGIGMNIIEHFVEIINGSLYIGQNPLISEKGVRTTVELPL